MEKYQSWDLVRDSGNNVTLESISRNIINIPKDLIEEISNNGALDIEIQNYEQKEKELEQRVQDVLMQMAPHLDVITFLGLLLQTKTTIAYL